MDRPTRLPPCPPTPYNPSLQMGLNFRYTEYGDVVNSRNQVEPPEVLKEGGWVGAVALDRRWRER